MGAESSVTKDPEKEAAILDAALFLFAERSFHGTAVPDIAARAGVGTGTIYRYFASKEELVNVLYRVWKTRLAAMLLDEFPEDAPPREQFRAFWRRTARFADVYPLAFRFLELHHHTAYLDEENRKIEARLLKPVHQFLDKTRNAGVTRPLSPVVILSLIWGAFVGLVKAASLGHLKLTPEVLDAAEDLCWDAILRRS